MPAVNSLTYFLAFLDLIIQALWTQALAKFATIADLTAVRNRVTQIEESDGPFVLSVDFETGYLQQTGTANGTFGVDYESGYLTFEPNSTEEET